MIRGLLYNLRACRWAGGAIITTSLLLAGDRNPASSASSDVPRRLGYWQFNSSDWLAGHGSAPLAFTNIDARPGIEGQALCVRTAAVPAYLRFRSVERDGRRNISVDQGAVRFFYKPLWSSISSFAPRNSPWGKGIPHAARLLELGFSGPTGWTPRFALSINPAGTELTFHTVGANGQSLTNFVATLFWQFVGSDDPSHDIGPGWREIVLNYTPASCTLIVDGALQQDVRNKAWAGPGLGPLSTDERNHVLSIGSSLAGDLPAEGLIDELETFDRPIGPLRNYRYASQTAASATVSSNPPAAKLNWINSSPRPVAIRRRLSGDTEWTLLGTNITGMSFVDASPELRRGQVYEYEIDKRALFVGINAVPVEDRGCVILLVDRTVVAPLASALEQYMSDLVGDGWTVVRHDVPRHDDRFWDSAPVNQRYIQDVQRIKSTVLSDYKTHSDRIKAVVIVGHVTIPYSGFGAEDGHQQNAGARPADTFYGDMDGNWTDDRVNVLSPNPNLRNIPGDGKFDANFFNPHISPSAPNGQSGIELAVGRIDFARLPAFAPRAELDLLRQYFAKNNRYRHKQLPFTHGIIAAGYFYSPYQDQSLILDANASWIGSRLHGVGSDLVFNGDMFFSPGACLWGMQGGYGAYDAINNVPDANRALGILRRSSADLAKPENEPLIGFYLLKGSFFADWNLTDDCFLRAVLATPNYGLGALFTMDTVWRFESAAVGEPLAAGLVRTTQGRQNVRTTSFFGDPTLRLFVTAPPTNLTARRSDKRVLLRWTASLDPGVVYHVYRSVKGIAPPFGRLTSTPLTSTEFVDTAPSASRRLYQVRALRLLTTGSGTFTNMSQGTFATTQ